MEKKELKQKEKNKAKARIRPERSREKVFAAKRRYRENHKEEIKRKMKEKNPERTRKARGEHFKFGRRVWDAGTI